MLKTRYVLQLHARPSVYVSGNPVCDPHSRGWKPLVWVRRLDKAARFNSEQEALNFVERNPGLCASPSPISEHAGPQGVA